MGLFSNIFQFISFFHLHLVLQRDFGESCTLRLVEKFNCMWEEKVRYFKFLRFRFFCFLFLLKWRESGKEVIHEKKLRGSATIQESKLLAKLWLAQPEPSPIIVYTSSACALSWCRTWRDVTWVLYAVRMHRNNGRECPKAVAKKAGKN